MVPNSGSFSAVPDEGLFEAILEAAPDAVLIVDQAGFIRMVNTETERLLGYQREELLGQPVERLVPEALRGGHAAHRARYISEPRTRPMGIGLDLHAQRKDGALLPVEISLSPLTTSGGTFVISILRDVTERRRIEVERADLLAREQEARSHAEAALQIRDQVLSAVSHDLRTPLATISLYGQALEAEGQSRDGPHTERLMQQGSKVRRAAQEGLAMIGELLDAARLGMGEELQLMLQPVDLAGLAEEVVSEHQAVATGHRFVLSNESTNVVGSWDRPRLKRVIGNLLTNAVKYSPLGSEVWVTVSDEEVDGKHWASLNVRDEGIGIPADELPRLFDWFYRGENAAGRRGSGVGLAGARRIVELHGGAVSVSSVEGSGSTFEVRLPLVLVE